jgi:hypothetical protein
MEKCLKVHLKLKTKIMIRKQHNVSNKNRNPFCE